MTTSHDAGREAQVIPSDREVALAIRLHMHSLRPEDHRYARMAAEYRDGKRDASGVVQMVASYRESLTRPPAQAGAASVEVKAAFYAGYLAACDTTAYDVDKAWAGYTPAASGEIPAGMVEEQDWMQMARDAAASVRPNSPWAGRVHDGMRDDGDEVRSAMAAIAAVCAITTPKASAETGIPAGWKP